MRLHDSMAAQAATAHGRQTNLSGAQQTLMTAVWSALGQSGSSGNVSDLAEALRSALSAGLAAGHNLAPDLANAINDALDRVRQTLASQGVDASRVAQLISGFRRQLSRAIDALDPVPVSSGPGAASGQTGSSGDSTPTSGTPAVTGSQSSSGTQPATGGLPAASVAQPPTAGYISRESESLQIVTADGDRVTIRFRQQDIVAVTAAQASDGTSGGSQAAAISSGRLQISVRGNLSADELKAIDDLISHVDALATQFFSGDLQAAFNSAAALGADPSQIAQFSLHLSYTRLGTGAFAAAVPTIAAPANTSAAPVLPSSAPVVAAAPPSTAGASAAPAPVAQASAAASAQSTQPASAVTSADSGTGTAQPGTGSSAGSAQQTIGSFIQEVLGKLGSVDGTSGMRFSMRWKLEVLAAALPAYAPTPQSAVAPATQLASQTLQSLAG